MSTFKFVGNNRYFNGVCVNDLVFDNKDSSENRIFCMESTCISPKASGLASITGCRTLTLPSGYTDKVFEFGVEGGPWTPVASSIPNFPASVKEYIGPGELRKVKVPSDPNGNFYNVVVFNGRATLVFNSNAFSNEFDIQDTVSAGYGPSISLDTVDPANGIVPDVFEPYTISACGDEIYSYEEPEISYYNVGVDPVLPATHDVVFSHALLVGSGEWLPPYANNDNSAPAVAYRENYILNGLPNREAAGNKQVYVSGVHPAMPPLSYYSDWNYNHVTINGLYGSYGTQRAGINVRGAKVYHPAADTNDTTKVIRGTTAGPEWHTGYRMQKYRQTAHYLKFDMNGCSLQFGYRDIETRIRCLGYYATWQIKSIVPEYILLEPYRIVGATDLYYTWRVRAIVTLEVSYHSFGVSSNPAYNYEYGSTLPSNAPVSCGVNRVYDTPTRWSPPWNRWMWAYNIACNPTNAQLGITTGNHYLITRSSSTTAWTPSVRSHYTNPLSNDASNIASPKSRKKIEYFTVPLIWDTSKYTVDASYSYSPTVDSSYISHSTQQFTAIKPANGARANFQVAKPTTPNDFKIWRRKIT